MKKLRTTDQALELKERRRKSTQVILLQIRVEVTEIFGHQDQLAQTMEKGTAPAEIPAPRAPGPQPMSTITTSPSATAALVSPSSKPGPVPAQSIKQVTLRSLSVAEPFQLTGVISPVVSFIIGTLIDWQSVAFHILTTGILQDSL